MQVTHKVPKIDVFFCLTSLIREKCCQALQKKQCLSRLDNPKSQLQFILIDAEIYTYCKQWWNGCCDLVEPAFLECSRYGPYHFLYYIHVFLIHLFTSDFDDVDLESIYIIYA